MTGTAPSIPFLVGKETAISRGAVRVGRAGQGRLRRDGCIISSTYKGFYDLHRVGLIDRVPQVIGVQTRRVDPSGRAGPGRSFQPLSHRCGRVTLNLPPQLGKALPTPFTFEPWGYGGRERWRDSESSRRSSPRRAGSSQRACRCGSVCGLLKMAPRAPAGL